MEKLYFPKKIYYLTQGYGENSYSHKYRKAIDVSSANINEYKKIYAPFSGYVAKVYAKKGFSYSIWLVSNEKVLCADGHTYYVVMMLTHPEKIKDFYVGKTFKQWDYLFDDGNTGNATGNHLDIELAIYKNKNDIKISWYKTKSGSYELTGSIDPTKYLCLKNDTIEKRIIYLNKEYRIEKENNVIFKEYQKGRYITLANLKVRTGPGKNYPQKLVKDLSKDGKRNATSKNSNDLALYKKGTVYDALEIIYNDGIWAKTYSGYVNIVDGIYTNCKNIN